MELGGDTFGMRRSVLGLFGYELVWLYPLWRARIHGSRNAMRDCPTSEGGTAVFARREDGKVLLQKDEALRTSRITFDLQNILGSTLCICYGKVADVRPANHVK